MRRKTEIAKALEELHKGVAEYLQVYGKDKDYLALAGIDLALHWVLGEDNQFQILVDSLSKISEAQAKAVGKMTEIGEPHDASRSN